MKKNDPKNKPPTDKRRKNRQAAKRREHTRAMRLLSDKVKQMRTDLHLVMVRDVMGQKVSIGVRRGLFGHPAGVILHVDDASIVGCVEDTAELAKFVNNLGILAASQLFGHNLAEGIEGLGKTMAKWAGIDLEALAKAAEADADDYDNGVQETAPALYVCPKCQSQWPSAEAMNEHFVTHIETEEAPVL